MSAYRFLIVYYLVKSVSQQQESYLELPLSAEKDIIFAKFELSNLLKAFTIVR